MLCLSLVASSSLVQPWLPQTVVPMRASVGMQQAVAEVAPVGFEWGDSFIFEEGKVIRLSDIESPVAKVDVETLMAEGRAMIEARTKTQQALKAMTLKREGSAAIEARSAAQQQLKVSTLRREGQATVVARKQAQARLDGLSTVMARMQAQAALGAEVRVTTEADAALPEVAEPEATVSAEPQATVSSTGKGKKKKKGGKKAKKN